MKMESDENRFHIKDLKKHVDLLVKPQEIIKTLHKVPQQVDKKKLFCKFSVKKSVFKFYQNHF